MAPVATVHTAHQCHFESREQVKGDSLSPKIATLIRRRKTCWSIYKWVPGERSTTQLSITLAELWVKINGSSNTNKITPCSLLQNSPLPPPVPASSTFKAKCSLHASWEHESGQPGPREKREWEGCLGDTTNCQCPIPWMNMPAKCSYIWRFTQTASPAWDQWKSSKLIWKVMWQQVTASKYQEVVLWGGCCSGRYYSSFGSSQTSPGRDSHPPS